MTVEENLGAEVLVFFPVDAPPVETDEIVSIRAGEQEEALLAQEARALFTARLPSGTRELLGHEDPARARSRAVLFLRPRHPRVTAHS